MSGFSIECGSGRTRIDRRMTSACRVEYNQCCGERRKNDFRGPKLSNSRTHAHTQPYKGNAYKGNLERIQMKESRPDGEQDLILMTR